MRPLALSALLLATALWGAPAPSPPPAPSSSAGAFQEGVPRLEASLLSERQQVSPGDSFRVGVRLQMAPGWHVYWRNPGEAGLASEVTLAGPGLAVGPLQWPAPSVLRSPDGSITTYGYTEDVVLFALAQTQRAVGPTLPLRALVDVLVCAVECIPATFSLERALPIGPGPVSNAAEKALLDAAASRVPLSQSQAGLQLTVLRPAVLHAGAAFSAELSAAFLDGRPAPLPPKDAFIPERASAVPSFSLEPLLGQPGRLGLVGRLAPEAALGPLVLQGVLRLAETPERTVEVTLSVGTVLPSGVRAEAGAGPGLGLVLLLAFCGGVLLNLMPCVFPVLALKAYGFLRTAQAIGSRAAGHALAYTLGILGSLELLAALVLALRAAGHAVGWGFQFQQPLFVAALTSLLLAFALNLFGLYRVGVGPRSLVEVVDAAHGGWRSAGEGALAVVLATPCTAPLLGTALGFAFAAPAWVVLLVFALVGLGLALPFVALVLVPRLGARLPRPGAWMERVRQLLGFALLATAVWLVSVLGGLAGVDGVVRLLAFLLAVAGALWVVGSWQDGRRAGAALGAALALVLSVGAAALRFTPEAPVAADAAWTAEAVATELRAGRPVFVDFTADWCLTCKFNERTVLSRRAVHEALANTRTRVLVADWTRPDARIAAELSARKRAGVPMYLLFSPYRPEQPEVLPELLSVTEVVDAVHRAASPLSAALSPTPLHTERPQP
ncbi:MAG: protein-disulfide reductase DsbD family protein [Myxococcaceae bacterium]